MRTSRPPLTLAILMLASIPITFPVLAQHADLPGSSDHPMVSRYAGSVIDGYDFAEFSDFDLPLGPAVRDDQGNRVASTQETLEGRITRIVYRGPKDRSTLEILRNYSTALEDAGFKELFSCSDDECGRLFWWLRFHDDTSFKTSGTFQNAADFRYLAMRRTAPDGITHVSIMIGIDVIFTKEPITLVEIIESEPMDTGMVTVDAEAMAEGIDATGHIDLYGIFFDTNSAQIQPDSNMTLEEITALMETRGSLKVLVVGHTDNQGGYDHNMDLSRRRAAAVVAALEGMGVRADRLRAAGVGYLAPVATNDSPNGRTKNRRVVLVKQ